MELKGMNGTVTVKDLKQFLETLTDDTEIVFMIEGEALGFNAQKIEFYPPEFNSAEEDEDWDEEDCVGEWHPTAMAFVIA